MQQSALKFKFQIKVEDHQLNNHEQAAPLYEVPQITLSKKYIICVYKKEFSVSEFSCTNYLFLLALQNTKKILKYTQEMSIVGYLQAKNSKSANLKSCSSSAVAQNNAEQYAFETRLLPKRFLCIKVIKYARSEMESGGTFSS